MRNRRNSAMAVVASGLLIGGWMLSRPLAGAEPDDRGCSNRTLRGEYGGSFDGQIPAGPNTIALRGLVLTRFDGRGNLIQEEFVTLNGVPPSNEWIPSHGTYEVNQDCTGRAEIIQADGRVLRQRWVVVNRGREIRAIVEGAVAGGTRVRID